MPNVTWLSQVDYLDDRHVALSCQFFRKTRTNLEADPRAQVLVIDPHSFKQWRLDLRFARRDASGPAFESMAMRIQAVAQLTQTEHVFKLQSADVFEVMMISEIEVRVKPTEHPARAPRDLVHVLAGISDIIAKSRGLEGLLQPGLEQLTRQLGYETLSVYLAEQSEHSLYAAPAAEAAVVQGQPRSTLADAAAPAGRQGHVAAHRARATRSPALVVRDAGRARAHAVLDRV
jgi:adenylate cyclase